MRKSGIRDEVLGIRASGFEVHRDLGFPQLGFYVRRPCKNGVAFWDLYWGPPFYRKLPTESKHTLLLCYLDGLVVGLYWGNGKYNGNCYRV